MCVSMCVCVHMCVSVCKCVCVMSVMCVLRVQLYGGLVDKEAILCGHFVHLWSTVCGGVISLYSPFFSPSIHVGCCLPPNRAVPLTCTCITLLCHGSSTDSCPTIVFVHVLTLSSRYTVYTVYMYVIGFEKRVHFAAHFPKRLCITFSKL